MLLLALLPAGCGEGAPAPQEASPVAEAPGAVIAPTEQDADPATGVEEQARAVVTTALVFDCVLPDGLAADERRRSVGAWFTAEGEDQSERCDDAVFENGRVTVAVPPGPGSLKMRVRDCVIAIRSVDAVEGAVTHAGVLGLVPARKLSGVVVDPDGEPVKAAIWPRAGEFSVPLTVTSDDGSFSFSGLPDMELVLDVNADGFVTQYVPVELGPGSLPVTVVMSRGGRVTGRVVDPDDQPASRARAWIGDVHDPENRRRMAWPRVGEDGRFEVHLAPGTYRITASKDRARLDAEFDVVDGGEQEITLRLVAR